MNQLARHETPPLDATDREIVRATQGGLPLVPQPYHAIAEQLDLDPATVMARVQRMTESGAIRRIGAIPNHYRLGVVANGMTVWDVDDADIARAGRAVGALTFVTHCYRRPRHLPDWPYNLFAMVHGKTREETADHVAEISDLLGASVRAHEVLYSTRILKKSGLRIAG